MAWWIPVRTDLVSDPRVILVAQKLSVTLPSRFCHACTVTGALVWLWSLADEHTTDGVLIGYDAARIDREVGLEGFAEALTDPRIDWLIIKPDRVEIPRFSEKNGISAKNRMQAAERQRLSRFRHAPVTEMSRSKRDKSVTTRQDKTRQNKEEEPPIVPQGGHAASAADDKPCVSKPPKERKPNPIWDGVMAAFFPGVANGDLAEADRKQIGKVVAALVERNGDPDEIARQIPLRKAEHERRWRKVTATMRSVCVSHWLELAPKPLRMDAMSRAARGEIDEHGNEIREEERNV